MVVSLRLIAICICRIAMWRLGWLTPMAYLISEVLSQQQRLSRAACHLVLVLQATPTTPSLLVLQAHPRRASATLGTLDATTQLPCTMQEQEQGPKARCPKLCPDGSLGNPPCVMFPARAVVNRSPDYPHAPFRRSVQAKIRRSSQPFPQDQTANTLGRR